MILFKKITAFILNVTEFKEKEECIIIRKVKGLLMSKKIASARIEVESSKLLKELNNSLPFDKKLYREDIEGSQAHSFMLMKQGIISKDDYENINRGLNQTLQEIESGKFSLDGDDEDIHMAIERRLTEIIGESGKKLAHGKK